MAHIVENWGRFAVFSHDRNEDNYLNCDVYFSEMSRSCTYGSSCELKAAVELFKCAFQIYCNGHLYQSFGDAGNPILRLRFTGDLSNGHFEPYYLPQERQEMLCHP